MSVFIHAPMEHRIQRKMDQEKLSYMKAKRLVRRMDQQRQKYYEHYTGRTWGAGENCDLRIDSEQTGIEGAVGQIAERYRSM